ncbi:MAG: tetratricopeptide repeat protein [Tannerella sp.]|jgi:tetratricopeptide (TPR) repeat protein|nr:tetratricopeptide repeat protein [Tannerella sp.]
MKNLYLIKYILFLTICTFLNAQESNRLEQIEDLLLKGEEMLKADPSKAIYYSNSAIVEAQKIKNQGYATMAQAILGEAYMNQGDFNMGFEVLTNAMETCPPDCLQIQAHIYVHLAGAYQKLKDLDQAFTYVDKAADIYEALNDSLNMARCYNSRGLVYIQVPDNVRAEENFKEALAINRKMNNITAITANLNNLCLYEGNTQEKIDMLFEAIAINQSLGKIWSLGENYNNLGTQYYYAHDYNKALAALDTAMDYSRQINAKELISDNYRYKSWVYEARKDYANAFHYLQLLYETEKELLTMNEMRQIELNIIQKRLRDKEQQMVMQEQAFQIKNLRLWIYITILIVVALVLVLFYVAYHYRNRKKMQLLEASGRLESREKELVTLKLKQSETEAQTAQQELEHNRKELTNLAFFIRSRNDLLTQIQEKIKAGYKLSASQAEGHLRSINAYISQFSAQDTDAELLIDEINGQFIHRLSVLHPNLSKNEQRLASLLRVGLSTKEIASIINSTPKTVNMARYRLRKHLNLETDDSLTEYMKQI